jgi:hypothetical protein
VIVADEEEAWDGRRMEVYIGNTVGIGLSFEERSTPSSEREPPS